MPIKAETRIKAQIIAGVINQVTGDSCLLIDREDTIKIVPTEKQKKWLIEFIDKQLDMGKKPDIEIDVIGIIFPVIWKRFWPYIAGVGGLSLNGFRSLLAGFMRK